jgi:hypothetical protein
MNFKNLRLWVFLFGAIFLLAAFLFQQSKENRKQLQLQSMKSIALTKQNFLETFDNYNSQLNSYLRRHFAFVQNTPDSEAARRMSEIFKDERKDYRIRQIEYLSNADLKNRHLNNISITIHQPDSTWIEVKNYLFKLNSSFGISCDNLEEDIFQYTVNCNDADAVSAFEITHFVDMYQLMKHNRNNDFFDAIYITDSSGSILYPSASVGLDLFDPQLTRGTATPSSDTVASKVGNLHFRLNISSVDHEIFSTKVKIGSQQLYLLGAKKSEDFSKVSLRINFNLLSIFILSLLFIFASTPIISIIKMDKGDILSQGKVFGAGLSLVLLAILLGFSFSFGRPPIQYEKHDIIAKQIADKFLDQINQFLSVLEKKVEKKAGIIAKTNELIEFNSDGIINSLTINDLKDHLEFETNLFTISNRDYVTELFFEDTLRLNRFFTSAHYSLSTGKLEGVISKRMTDSTGKAVTFGVDSFLPNHREDKRFYIFKGGDGKILFFSEKMKIPVNTLEEAIGEAKWTEINTLLKNNEKGSDGLTWSLPLYVNGYEYEGILTRIKTNKFDQSLWVIYLVNNSLDHTKASLIAMESFAFLLAHFSLLILLSAFNSLAKRNSIYLNIKRFSYSWISPSVKKRSWYIMHNYILFLDILIFALLVYYMDHLDVFTVFLLSSFLAIHASLSKFILIYPNPGQRFSHIGLFYILPALILFFTNFEILRNYLENKQGAVPYAVVASMGFLSLILAWIFILKFIEAQGKTIRFILFPVQRTIDRTFSKIWHQISAEHNDIMLIFAINFFFWTMLIGVMPGYLIHRAVTHHEDYLWINAQPKQENDTSRFDSDFKGPLQEFERYRRIFFSRIINQDEPKIANFLAPDLTLIKKYFNKKMDQEENEKLLNKAERGALYIVFFIIIASFFVLVIVLTKRIFLTEYLFTHNRYHLPKPCKKSPQNFIVCIDNRIAMDWIFHQFDLQPNEIDRYDFIEHPDKLDLVINANKAVILQNIHCIKDIKELKSPMLALLNKCKEANKILFITSGSSLKDLINALVDPYDKLVFSEVFSDFISYTIPINYQRKAYNLPYPPFSIEDAKLASNKLKDQKIIVLKNEVNYGANSRELSALITDEILCDPLENKISEKRFEKILLILQRHNKGFYLNIWNELDQRERKMVYYYAQEGFINYTNRDTLTELIQKGIFTLSDNEDGLVLFSLSFRNFVNLMITEMEIKIFKEDERKHGNMANIRTAAFSFIFLSIALISYYDPTVLNKTSAYVSGVIGLIGTVTSLLSRGIGNFSWRKKADNG